MAAESGPGRILKCFMATFASRIIEGYARRYCDVILLAIAPFCSWADDHWFWADYQGKELILDLYISTVGVI